MSIATKIERDMENQAVNYLIVGLHQKNTKQVNVWASIANKFFDRDLLTKKQILRITYARRVQ